MMTMALKTDQITTARLPMATRLKLETLARGFKKTKSEIIIDALEMYYEKEENELDSYTLGLPYFGNYSIGNGDLSKTYKQRLSALIREKHERKCATGKEREKLKRNSAKTIKRILTEDPQT